MAVGFDEYCQTENLFGKSKEGAIIIFCIQHTGDKVKILNETIDTYGHIERVFETDLQFEYKDNQTGHSSKTNYKIVAVTQ